MSRIENQLMMQPVHPALDVVGDTLYVTVQIRVSGNVILTSDGELYSIDEWPDVCRSRGLLPLTEAGVSTTLVERVARLEHEMQAVKAELAQLQRERDNPMDGSRS